MWADDREEESQREDLLAEAEGKDDGVLDAMPDVIEEAATQMIAAAPSTDDKR